VAPNRTGHGILGCVDGAGRVVSCVMIGVCVGVESGAVVAAPVVFGGGGGERRRSSHGTAW
jgi:hypothetical protein